MKLHALWIAAAALVMTSCGEPGDMVASGVVEACAEGDLSGQCQLRGLVSESLASYVAGAPQSLEAEHVWRMGSREEHVARVNLVGGEDYFIIGACDRECLDIDMFLRDAGGSQVFDADGNPLQDILLDRVPVISFTPPQDGEYAVALLMLDCLVAPCYAGVRVMRLVLNPFAEARHEARLRSGVDDLVNLELEAGGDRTWSSVEQRCSGHFDTAPHLGFMIAPGEVARPLVVSAGPADAAVSPFDPSHDTTLMVYQFEGGVWLCDDDSGVGRNASLTIDEPNGRYAVWVGAYLPDARPRTRLLVSEQLSQ